MSPWVFLQQNCFRLRDSFVVDDPPCGQGASLNDDHEVRGRFMKPFDHVPILGQPAIRRA